MSEWRDGVREVGREAPWTIGYVFKVVVLPLVGISLLLSVMGYAFGWFGEAAQVAQEEFGPRAALTKYEWFKDAAAVIAKKHSDIQVYQGRIDRMREDYEGKSRADWDRTDKEQLAIWESEVAGVKASHNQLAAEYNAASSKFNWSSFEGDLPPGSEKLPRTVKPYIEQ